MEFSLSAIEQAHQQYTGVDFPKLFAAFKDMGMTYNTVNIQKGIATYIHPMEEDVIAESVKANSNIAGIADVKVVQDVLIRHQQGQTDFPTFCNEIAQAGIYKWLIDINQGTCTYLDLQDNAIVSEQIPQ
ncbi:DUF1398 family protein [Staphylococcus simiae]|uniref:DUF1398 domain-containing protein n=1 Tax=Staphylococcus simiae TaxID=308354 RepID=UPI001A959185|nr:DUF1398 family protein [Staphylococcus simiae]MBO1198701.1 DUF1398 family protein [Staphylococcus simiae]MBO1200953.1 DUF1398 family protein [Staphylococcus simiae]MBO1203202.1 DUF1398 family protein [Staphylococcus simiae]MBO1210690.1 DUF1398 family protein [Staphylococcus simiae]MBO1229291.1 DUF1398 family protein [Staphylococcus simiae]